MRLYGSIGGLVVLAGCATAVANEGTPAPDGSPPHQPTSDASTADSSDLGSNTSGGCAQPTTGVLASWDFAGQPGSQSSTASSTSAPGVMAKEVTRGPGIASAAGAGSINASNWTTAGQPDQTQYFSLSIQPPSGCALDITALQIDAKASGTGPSHATVATSVDGFAQSIHVSTNAPSNVQLSLTQATGAVEVRVYGYSATAAGGTLRLKSTLTITGSLH